MHRSVPVTDSAIKAAMPELCQVSKGTYTGNGAADRAIPHGLGKAPSMVIIGRTSDKAQFINRGTIQEYLHSSSFVRNVVLTATATDFYLHSTSSNVSSGAFDWVAFS